MRRHASLSSIMAGLMGASTFALIIASVLAADLIAEFSLDRWQVGLLATASAISGALLAPVLGLSNRHIGAKIGTIVSFTVSGLVLGVMALAPVYAVLLFAAVLSGIPQAMSNPATNKLISLHVEPGSRGVITGIKQSGVQVGVFFGGLTLPIIAAASGWRIAVSVYVGLALAGAAVSAWQLPADPADEHADRGRSKGPLPPIRPTTFALRVSPRNWRCRHLSMGSAVRKRRARHEFTSGWNRRRRYGIRGESSGESGGDAPPNAQLGSTKVCY